MDIRLNESELHTFYTGYFGYYNTLSSFYQKRFVERSLAFIDSKVISGADGFVVNNKVKAIVAASAVQLTLGLETWDYDYFLEIIIHPRIYTNKHTNLQYKGETNLQGYIHFSWLSFINGYKDPYDNINLGIHEFTHALRFNSIRGNAQDYYIKYFFIKWLYSAYEAFNDIRQGKKTIFRQYGGANMNEFISVCFEHYFESPLQIKQQYPHLYYNTAILLNQVNAGNKTMLDIREYMFREKNELSSPLISRKLKQKLNSDTSVKLLLITLTLLGITASKIGLMNGPCFVLFVVALFFYLRMEWNFLKMETSTNTIRLTKGFFLLRNRIKKDLLLSQLVNVQYTEAGDDVEMIFVYYNFGDKHFYEEAFECDKEEGSKFLAELKANKIAIQHV